MTTSGGIPSSTSWTTSRKAAAAAFALGGIVLMACAASYSAAVLFLVSVKTSPRSATPTSLLRYWQAYGEDVALRKKLLVAGALSAVTWFVVVPAWLVAGLRQRRPLHGAARFATTSEIQRAGLVLDSSATASPSILVGRHRGKFLALPGQLSVMLSAPTRSGKGVGVVIPNLLNWPDSVVVLDIKGENHAVTSGYRAGCGQAVYAFSPFDDGARSHRWNPLTAVRTDSAHRVGDLLAIGQILYPNDGNGSSETFFNDQARNLFLGLGLLVIESPDLPRSIGELLRQSSGKGRPVTEHLSALIEQRRTSARPLSSECVDALQRLLSNSENTLASIVATFNAPLTIFADPVVDAATSGDDFRLADVRRRAMSVYVRVPPNRLLTARPLLNLFFSELVAQNTQSLPCDELDRQCLLIHDEFPAMGRVGVLSSSIAFLAGYNLRLLTVVQAMSQLDSVYGEKEARTFATNHGLQILFAPREQRDADEYSAMLGTFTDKAASRSASQSFGHHAHRSVSRSESEQRRALLMPQEFKELGAERLVAILENCKPILGEKIRYHEEPVFRRRLLPPQDVPSIDLALHVAKVEQRISALPDELAADATLDVDSLVLPIDLPDLGRAPTAEQISRFVDLFLDGVRMDRSNDGGSIESADTGDSDTEEVHLTAESN